MKGRRHKEPKPTRRRSPSAPRNASVRSHPEYGSRHLVGSGESLGWRQAAEKRHVATQDFGLRCGSFLLRPKKSPGLAWFAPNFCHASKTLKPVQMLGQCPGRCRVRRHKEPKSTRRPGSCVCAFPQQGLVISAPPQPTRRPPISHSAQKHTLALRGAKGDRRAKRGSSRSKSRAALGEWWSMESPKGLPRGSEDARQAQRGRPGGVQRGPRRGGSP